MTPYQILKRHRFLCKGKIPHTSESAALDALIEKMVSPNAYLPEQLTIYVCRACGYLHVGHEPKWKDNGHREKENLGRGEELRSAMLETAFERGARLDRSMRGS